MDSRLHHPSGDSAAAAKKRSRDDSEDERGDNNQSDEKRRKLDKVFQNVRGVRESRAEKGFVCCVRKADQVGFARFVGRSRVRVVRLVGLGQVGLERGAID